MSMNMKTTRELQIEATNRWRKQRKAEGWIYQSNLIPPALVRDLRNFIAQWKQRHPGVYLNK